MSKRLDTKLTSAQTHSTVPEKTGIEISLSFLQAFTMKHSAAASSFTPSNELHIKGCN